MPFLLAVVLTALRWGRGPAIVAAIAGVAAFDFLMVPPFHTLAVDDVQYLITFASFLVVAIVISELAVRSKERADTATERARLLERLHAAELAEAREELHVALLQAMSHDLRTPLVSITGALSILLDENLPLTDPERRELVDNALAEAHRLNGLVGDLLDVTRLEAGALPLRMAPCDVADLVGASLSQLGRRRLGAHPVSTQVPAQIPPVEADFVAVTHVLVNLLENAANYSCPDCPIEVRAELQLRQVGISVSDRGPGIPAESREGVFQRGVRLSATERPSGTGLGLTICKGIVEAHGGRIELRERPGGGLEAMFTLPVAMVAAAHS
jgi:two-component system sensor histidine kinase KdpD